ncbi:FAD:protein FMN transferase [Collibacillus ludicampi]|uniref:FAD:protein FMN transferase n=1 Tax=Collibacillus ludicampi TaxID=2771369 RepID=A0AAV4LFR9_9BACL|nr:FAD:protein FMN transferase [Collibacillus ludicampi]GIM46613.1 FAD:protein FMN transferase [Collibacillus ludicampi]
MSEQSFTFRAMNTQIELLLVPDRVLQIFEKEKIFANIRALFQQVENTCSRFLPDSELSLLNQTPERDVPVSPLLFELLVDAYDAFIETNGMFNPGLLTHLEAAGYDKSLEKASQSQEEPSFYPCAVHTKAPFEIDKIRKTVWLSRGVKIDLGGIAKGWTVDRAVEYLKPFGTGFINAGGDLRVFGRRDGFWKIGVENPFDPEKDLGVISIRDGAIATSSTWKRRWKKGANWMNHLIDPRTGQPTQSEIVSVTVTAPTAKEADVWAKTVLLLGMERGTTFVQERQVCAVLVDRNLNIRSIPSGLA